MRAISSRLGFLPTSKKLPYELWGFPFFLVIAFHGNEAILRMALFVGIASLITRREREKGFFLIPIILLSLSGFSGAQFEAVRDFFDKTLGYPGEGPSVKIMEAGNQQERYVLDYVQWAPQVRTCHLLGWIVAPFVFKKWRAHSFQRKELSCRPFKKLWMAWFEAHCVFQEWL